MVSLRGAGTKRARVSSKGTTQVGKGKIGEGEGGRRTASSRGAGKKKVRVSIRGTTQNGSGAPIERKNVRRTASLREGGKKEREQRRNNVDWKRSARRGICWKRKNAIKRNKNTKSKREQRMT